MRTVELKIYPAKAQQTVLESWLSSSAWLYNHMLAQRIKAYKRRGKSPSAYDQHALLTKMRARSARLAAIPLYFQRDAINRVDFAFKSFFRRHKQGLRGGFPRFKSRHRYDSMTHLRPCAYGTGARVCIPKLGDVRCRGLHQITDTTAKQRSIRVLRRGDSWFVQLVCMDTSKPVVAQAERTRIGLDLGLKHFAALSDGSFIANPRFGKKSEAELRVAQQSVSRKTKGSGRRRKAVLKLRKVHERIAARRRDFACQTARDLVSKHSLIAHEKLNVKGLARGRYRKSVNDVAWAIFLDVLTRKAEGAGCQVIAVDAKYTSQTCPSCGRVAPKLISDRTHNCQCGCVLDRDVAASRVILGRALGVSGALKPVEVSVSTVHASARHARLMKREVLVSN